MTKAGSGTRAPRSPSISRRRFFTYVCRVACRARRGVPPPDVIDQLIDRHDIAGVNKKVGEHGGLSGSAQMMHPAVGRNDRDGTENPERDHAPHLATPGAPSHALPDRTATLHPAPTPP